VNVHTESPGDEQALDIESARHAGSFRRIGPVGSVHDELIEHGQKCVALPCLEAALGIRKRKAEQDPAQEHLAETEDIPLRRRARSRQPAAADHHVRPGPGGFEQQGAVLDRGGQVHIRQQHDFAVRGSNAGAQGGCLTPVWQLEDNVGGVHGEGNRIVGTSIISDDQFGGEGTCLQPCAHDLEHSCFDRRALVIGWNYNRQRNQDALSPNGST